MKFKDVIINLKLNKEFTPLKAKFEKLIKKERLKAANLVCWVPHEVSSIVQIGWEDGLLDDLKDFLKEVAPAGKWTKHDEPGTKCRHNFHQHIRTKLVGNVSLTLLVKNKKLEIGKYQDLYYYSPVWKEVPNQRIVCRVCY